MPAPRALKYVPTMAEVESVSIPTVEVDWEEFDAIEACIRSAEKSE